MIPLVHTSALVPSAILAGQAEMRIYSSADAVYPLLDYAVDNGWTAQSLMQCGAELMEVQEATDRYRHHMWACCVVFLIWVALDLAVRARVSFESNAVADLTTHRAQAFMSVDVVC